MVGFHGLEEDVDWMDMGLQVILNDQDPVTSIPGS